MFCAFRGPPFLSYLNELTPTKCSEEHLAIVTKTACYTGEPMFSESKCVVTPRHARHLTGDWQSVL